jgi:hypothetical protein
VSELEENNKTRIHYSSLRFLVDLERSVGTLYKVGRATALSEQRPKLLPSRLQSLQVDFTYTPSLPK